MKFSKSIAEALANKTLKQLRENRDKAIQSFMFSDEECRDIMDLIKKAVIAKSDYTYYQKRINEITSGGAIYNSEFDTEEKLYSAVKRCIASERFSLLPSFDDLVDDFLIASIDSENSDELISKIIKKYTEEKD